MVVHVGKQTLLFFLIFLTIGQSFFVRVTIPPPPRVSAVILYQATTDADLDAIKQLGFNAIIVGLPDGDQNNVMIWDLSFERDLIIRAGLRGLYTIVLVNENLYATYWQAHQGEIYMRSGAPDHTPRNSFCQLTPGIRDAYDYWITAVMNQLGDLPNIIAWAPKNSMGTFGEGEAWYDHSFVVYQSFMNFAAARYQDNGDLMGDAYGIPAPTRYSWVDSIQWLYDNVVDPYNYLSGHAPSAFTSDWIEYRRIYNAQFWNYIAKSIRAKDPSHRLITVKNSVGGEITGHDLAFYDLLSGSYDICGSEADPSADHMNWIYGLLLSQTRWGASSKPIWCVEIEAWKNWDEPTWMTVEANIKIAIDTQRMTGIWWSSWDQIKNKSTVLNHVQSITNYLLLAS